MPAHGRPAVRDDPVEGGRQVGEVTDLPTTRELVCLAAWHLFSDVELLGHYRSADEAGRLAVCQPPRAPRTTVFASSCTCLRWSAPRKDSP